MKTQFFREVRYAVKDINKVEFDFEVEALADFKFTLNKSQTNLESQNRLAKSLEEAICKGEELEISQEEAMSYV